MAKKSPHPVYDGVQSRVIDLCFTWQIVRDLYLDTPGAAKVMNDSAPALFAQFRRGLLDQLTLGVSVLADPAMSKHAGHESFSFASLMLEAEVLAEPKNAANLGEAVLLYRDFKKQVEPFKKHRNKRIAHADAHVTPGLPPLFEKELRAVLRTTFELMNRIALVVGATSTEYAAPAMLGCGQSLLDCLKRGKKAIAIEQWCYDSHPDLDSVDAFRGALLKTFFDRNNPWKPK